MPAQDRLELIRASGAVEFHVLDPEQGMIKIGSDSRNDIVIESPGVAAFHAVLVYSQWLYQLMALAEGEQGTRLRGEPLPLNQRHPVDYGDKIEIDGHILILFEGQEEPSSEETKGTPPEQQEDDGEDEGSKNIWAELSEQQWTINTGQTVSFELKVANTGPRVADFQVHVDDLPPEWVTITPKQFSLNVGDDRQRVTVTVSPPRLPSSQAKTHAFGLVVTAREHYKGERRRCAAWLTINPYYQIALRELSPKKQRLAGLKMSGRTKLAIINEGNSSASLRLEAFDDEDACKFKFQMPPQLPVADNGTTKYANQVEMRLPYEESVDVSLGIRPKRRRLFGAGQVQHHFTVTATLLEEGALETGASVRQEKTGDLISRPLISSKVVWVLLLLLVVGAVYVLWPPSPIRKFQQESAPGDNQPLAMAYSKTSTRLRDEQPTDTRVTLAYEVLRFPKSKANALLNLIKDPLNLINGRTLNIKLERKLAGDDELDYEVVQTRLKGPTGRVIVDPAEAIQDRPDAVAGQESVEVVYRLTVENWLTAIIPTSVQTVTTSTVNIGTLRPEFPPVPSDPIQVEPGESVTLPWTVTDADHLVLREKDGPVIQTIDQPARTGAFRVTPQADTVYILEAYNSFTGPDWPITVEYTVSVSLPLPSITFFQAQPNQVTAGEPVELSWQVSGADEKKLRVRLVDERTGIEYDVPSQHQISVRPTEDTVYKLEASVEGTPGTTEEYAQILVNPAPSPTPVPEKPRIVEFVADPPTLVAGGQDITTLSWRVEGTTTNIQISGPSLPEPLTNLKANHSVRVPINETSLFVLTAFNQDQGTSANTLVQVVKPDPTIIPRPVVALFEARDSADDKILPIIEPSSNRPKITTYCVPTTTTHVYLKWEVLGSDPMQVTLTDADNRTGRVGPSNSHYSDNELIDIEHPDQGSDRTITYTLKARNIGSEDLYDLDEDVFTLRLTIRCFAQNCLSTEGQSISLPDTPRVDLTYTYYLPIVLK